MIESTPLDEINAPDSTLRTLERTPNPLLWYRYGEDPARFLGRDLEGGEGADLTLARVRGITDLDLLQEYITIEGEVFQRPAVLGALNRRKAYLREWADQLDDDREIVESEPDVDEDEEPTVYRHVAEDCRSEDVERVSGMALECHGCGRRVPNNRVEEVDQ